MHYKYKKIRTIGVNGFSIRHTNADDVQMLGEIDGYTYIYATTLAEQHESLLFTKVTLSLQELQELELQRYLKSADTEVLQSIAMAKAEATVQKHINTTIKDLGYDDENSIAKYLVEGNPFYDECAAISIWIGNVWVYAHQVQADIVVGNRTMPTIEELIEELPKLVV